MESINLLIVYFVNIGLLWLFLGIFTLYQTSTSVMKKKGYNEEYIVFQKKDCRSRNLGIALGLPIIELFAAFITWLIFGELNTMKHLWCIVLISFICIIPFPIMDMKKTNKEYKKLAVQTKTDVVIDLNYRILHMVFKPRWELVTSIYYILYAVFFHLGNYLGIIHISIVWALYLIARSWKNMTRQSMKDGYIVIFILMTFNNLLAMYHLIRIIFLNDAQVEWIGLFSGILLAVILLGKQVYYIDRFPRFKRKLKEQECKYAQI